MKVTGARRRYLLSMKCVLLTGATGFVGSALRPALERSGVEVRCGSRQPDSARLRQPNATWVQLEVGSEASLTEAMRGVDSAVYLIHSMGVGGDADWERREEQNARRFANAAEAAGVKRIVYLGGVAPSGTPSKHLRSRVHTGQVLRAGGVPVIELRAGMIIGPRSESWRIVRDLSVRLPAMVLPKWLGHRSQPVAIRDVVDALVHAATSPFAHAGVYGLPGPEALTGEQLLDRVAALRGHRAVKVHVPFLTPWLSSWWIAWVTRANPVIARELIEGLKGELISHDVPYWSQMRGHGPLRRFDAAARAALAEEESTLPLESQALEWCIEHLAPWRRVAST